MSTAIAISARSGPPSLTSVDTSATMPSLRSIFKKRFGVLRSSKSRDINPDDTGNLSQVNICDDSGPSRDSTWLDAYRNHGFPQVEADCESPDSLRPRRGLVQQNSVPNFNARHSRPAPQNLGQGCSDGFLSVPNLGCTLPSVPKLATVQASKGLQGPLNSHPVTDVDRETERRLRSAKGGSPQVELRPVGLPQLKPFSSLDLQSNSSKCSSLSALKLGDDATSIESIRRQHDSIHFTAKKTTTDGSRIVASRALPPLHESHSYPLLPASTMLNAQVNTQSCPRPQHRTAVVADTDLGAPAYQNRKSELLLYESVSANPRKRGLTNVPESNIRPTSPVALSLPRPCKRRKASGGDGDIPATGLVLDLSPNTRLRMSSKGSAARMRRKAYSSAPAGGSPAFDTFDGLEYEATLCEAEVIKAVQCTQYVRCGQFWQPVTTTRVPIAAAGSSM